MELTGKKLEEILNTELVGRDVGYSYWNFTNALFKIIRILAKEAGLDENAFSSTVHGTQSAHLTYKGVVFGDASFQKQKGKYCRGGYEWSFKKIFVNFLNEDGCSSYEGLTFQEMLDRIDAEILAKKSRAELKLEQAKQIFQKIKTELGTASDYEVIEFIKYMNENKYSLYE